MRKLTKPEFYSNKRQTETNKERLETASVHLNRCYPKAELSTVILPGLTKIKHKYPGKVITKFCFQGNICFLHTNLNPLSKRYFTADLNQW